jgi:methanogenic corrinoid protein MtbC1
MGNAISDVAKLNEDELESMYKEFVGDEVPHGTAQPETVISEKVDIHQSLQSLIMALKVYKLDIISHELEKVKNSIGPRDFALGLITPLLTEVGKQVENGQITIAQEHSLSAIIKFHIGQQLYTNIGRNQNQQQVIALSTPEGELHEFGIMIASLLCGFYNLKFYYMGPSMPGESLAEACNQINADLVILGVSSSYNNSYARRLDEYITTFTETLHDGADIIIGGDIRGQSFAFTSHRISYVPSLQMLDNKLSHRAAR